MLNDYLKKRIATMDIEELSTFIAKQETCLESTEMALAEHKSAIELAQKCKTELKQARKRADEAILDLKIKKWQREHDSDFVPDWGNCHQLKWMYFYDHTLCDLVIESRRNYHYPNIFHFSSESAVVALLREFDEEIKRVQFGVVV